MRVVLSSDKVSAALAAAASLVLAAAARAEPPRSGEIVRVERPRFGGSGLRVCPVDPVRRDRLTCYGSRAPRAGTRYAVLGMEGFRGHVEATSISPSDNDFCGLGVAHDVFVDGLELAVADGIGVAVTGAELGPRSRLMLGARDVSPSGVEDEEVWMVIDRDGDEAPDIVATAYDCPEADDRVAPPGKTLTKLCLDYWTRDGGPWRRVTRDIFYSCR